MINKLEELVFGLNSYEKVKIEDRYLEIEELIPELIITNIEEFEILENSIFKIKEQIRIKSSNLNTIIKKTNKLTKKKVNSIIQRLEKLKYKVINFAFSNDQSFRVQEELQHIEETLSVVEEKNNKISKEISQINSKLNEKELKNISKIGKITIFEKNENIFESNLIRQKELSTKLFETQKYIATLILINSDSTNTFGINDKELHLSPLIQKRDSNAINVEETYSKILQFKSKNNTEAVKEEKRKENIVEVETRQMLNSKDEYIQINNEIQQMTSKKDEEDSLENLLNSKEDTHKHIYVEPKKEDNSILVSKGENEIIIEKDVTINPETKEVEEKIKTYSENNETTENEKSKEDNKESQPNSFAYEDDSIILKSNKRGVNEGQFIINYKNKIPLINNDQSTIIYSTLFSKAILHSIFETIQPQATMLITSLNSTEIQLIPRYIDDLIFKFGGKQETPETLENIQTKILQTMANELIEEKKPSEIKENKKKPQIIETTTTEVETKEDKTKRAEYLLSSLRRLA